VSTSKAISRLLLLGFVLTPIFGLQDWLEVLPVFNRYVNIESQLLIKAMKDMLLGAVFLLFVLDILSGRSFSMNPLVWLMLSLALIAALITSAGGKPFLALIGLRSLSPLLLIFIAYNYLDMAFMKKLLRVLVFVFVLECCAATLQLLLGVPINGYTFLNLAARPFGTFGNPWSLAAFICFVVCFRMGCDVHWYGRPTRTTRVFALVAAFFVYMTASGAGVLTFAAILAVYALFLWRAHPYAKAAVVPTLLLAPAATFLNLALLTGRQTIFNSVRGRLGILDAFVNSLGLKEVLIGKDMGAGSNAAVALTRLSSAEFHGAETLFISDSLYVSLASQVGLVFLLCFLAFNILLFRKAICHRYQDMNPVAIMMIPAVMIVSLGNNVLELFPVNWLMCIVYGVALRQGHMSAGYLPGTMRRTSELHSYRHEALA
jgi:hypothetical protein